MDHHTKNNKPVKEQISNKKGTSYKDTFKYLKDEFSEKEIEQIQSTIPYFKNFLNRYSQPAGVRVKIVDLALYCKKHFNKSILEITLPEMEQFFDQYISNLPGRTDKYISKSTANRWRIFIKMYFKIVNVYRKAEKKPPIENPVPPKEIWDFEKIEQSLEFLFDDDQDQKNYVTYDIIKKVVEQLYINYISARTPKKRFIEYQVFIAVSLQVYSGARIKEVCHAKLNDLNLKGRHYKTIVKSPKTNKRKGLYFFPAFFIDELTYYITKLHEQYPDLEPDDHLFHFPTNKDSYLSTRIVQYRIQRIKQAHNLQFKRLTHPYRDFLNTKRSDMGLLNQNTLKFLLMQKARDVNPQSYLKRYKSLEYLRSLYDKYNPYKALIKPTPSLDLL